jgi:signal transduction histidine kinase
MYLFILGVLVAQLTYITIQWLQLKYQEYLLYAAYILTFILYAVILFQEDVLKITENSRTFLIIDGFKRPLAFLLYFEYFLFAQHFIDLKSRFPGYHKILQPLKKIIIGFIVCMAVFRLLNIQYSTVGNLSYYVFSIFLFVVFIVFIIKLWKSNDRLIRYVLWASLSVSVGAFLSNLLIVGYMTGLVPEFLSNYYFIPTCIGAGFEIYFLNTGITYKISLAEKKLISTQKELIDKLTENQILLTEQQSMRNKIAQDLHDDVGATLSGIALHSHLAARQMAENKTESVINSLNQIASGAVEMVNTLNDVVWTVNPKNDGADQMVERLKEYAFSMAQTKNISIQWKVSDSVGDMKLSMEIRRSLYLICKEAINNAVKYADCNDITVTGEQTGLQLFMAVTDNGKGFELNDQVSGHGLKNMMTRAEDNKMILNINTAKGKGTTIGINYQITQRGMV